MPREVIDGAPSPAILKANEILYEHWLQQPPPGTVEHLIWMGERERLHDIRDAAFDAYGETLQ